MKTLLLDIWPPSSETDAFKILFNASIRTNIHTLRSTRDNYDDIDVVIIISAKGAVDSLLEEAIGFVSNKIYRAAMVVVADDDNIAHATEMIELGVHEYLVKSSLIPSTISRLLACAVARKQKQLDAMKQYQDTVNKLSGCYRDVEKLYELTAIELRGALKKIHAFLDLAQLNFKDSMPAETANLIERIQLTVRSSVELIDKTTATMPRIS